MPEDIQEIDTSAAASAMDEAGGFDNLMKNQDQESRVNDPQQAPDQTTEGTTVGSEEHIRQYLRDQQGRFAEKQAQEDTDSFTTRADLEALLEGVTDPTARERIERAHKSFQGGYTRKAQEFAEFRKQYEVLGQPDELKQAVDVYQQLQDPENWPQLYNDLAVQLEQMGLTPEQASQEAANAVATEQASQEQDPLARLADDPDFAPIKDAFASMKAEVKAMQDQLQEQREQEQQEQLQMRLVGELNRMESGIRAQKSADGTPRYNDDDITEIYELSSYYDGNLIEAQKRFDDSFNRRLESYVNRKSAASGAPPAPGGDTISSQPVEPPRTFEEASKLADEYIRSAELSGI